MDGRMSGRMDVGMGRDDRGMSGGLGMGMAGGMNRGLPGFKDNFVRSTGSGFGLNPRNTAEGGAGARMKASDAFGVSFGSFGGSNTQTQKSAGIDMDFRSQRGVAGGMASSGTGQGPPRGTW